MNDCTVNILGTEYSMEFKYSADDPLLKTRDGYVDPSAKKIVIRNKESDCEIANFDAYQKKVIRHEIIHAYFDESGLSCNIENPTLGVPETYVDWFAIQGPKIYKTYLELGVLDFPASTPANMPELHTISDFVDWSGTIARSHGMDSKTTLTELVSLIHSEVSEFLEEFRSGHEATETYYAEDGKPMGAPSELADVVIYCFITADLYEIDLEKAIIEKLEYNKNRPYKHGKEF